MLGAIIGDMVGSIYEFANTKRMDFPFFSERSTYTDDSIMTVAVAEWLLSDNTHSHGTLEDIMVKYANEYPCPMGGYGGGFSQWLFRPERLVDYMTGELANGRCPYNSWGNGSAMRASAVGWKFSTLEETERVAELSASITHDHPEGIKGAQATTAAIFLARTGKSKEEIKEYIEARFGYDLGTHTDEIRKVYGWESSCQGTVPPAIRAFLDSTDFESAVRIAVSLGGDSDTLACITGGIAEAYYKFIPDDILKQAIQRLPAGFLKVLKVLHEGSYYKLNSGREVKPEDLLTTRRYTPEHINELADNEVFVFGSNLNGWHGGGAAAAAHMWFGAIWGVGVGIQGQSYAIPTMQGGIETIKPFVDEFIQYAREHQDKVFLVTRIGCGIAGFRDDDIAPLFEECVEMDNVVLPKSFHQVIEMSDGKRPKEDTYNLARFHEAQNRAYQTALQEIIEGYKWSHWMWFIFPQIKGLGHSHTSMFYAISSIDEAKAYLEDVVLGFRLREISTELLKHADKDIDSILGGIDSMKLKSSMTLFDAVSPDDVFAAVLNVFYGGKRDSLTCKLINLSSD